MALFGFRTRNPRRDRETDTARFDRLRQLLGQLRAELEDERRGLKFRYERAQTSAAFAQEAFENGGGADLSLRVGDLTASMMRYHERIATLERQIAFVRGLEQEAIAFAGEMVGSGDDSIDDPDESFSRNVAGRGA